MESPRGNMLDYNKKIVHDRPSALNIFPTINNSPRSGVGGQGRFVTQTGRDQQYVRDLPLGGDGDQYDYANEHSRRKYPLKDYYEAYVTTKPMLLNKKAPKVKAKK